MRLPRLAPVLLLSLLAGPLGGPRAAVADDKVLGEATELTEKVRADALKLIDTVSKSTVEKDVLAARRGLLKLGPVVWPVIENALRLGPPEGARPHLNLLKAMLAKKTEPEFEALRARLRKRMMMDDLKGMQSELAAFRLGLPDPAKPGKRLPLSCKSTKVGSTVVYRSSDGSLVVGYGNDADEKAPDAPEASVTDSMAGFVAVFGGKPVPFERQSGRGADTTANATNGFAWAWASDGAPGKAPGGAGGVAGAATASGGAGQFARSGDGGAGAPG
ncbi:MAG: hypothetical protein JNM10_16220 [Planctomycetia bacterium]|nr:hypothetical protein [Planctomycetia bacterium]